jgi:hypothetical protein
MSELLYSVYVFFAEDPLRLLYVIGSSGGLIYWYDRIRNRPRLQVSILREGPTFDIEAENLGSDTMSLRPTVKVTGYDIRTGEKRKAILEVDDKIDRSLPSHDPKRIKLYPMSAADKAALNDLCYRTYHFKASRGRGTKVRRRFVDEGLRLPQYWAEVTLLRFEPTRVRLVGWLGRRRERRVGTTLPPFDKEE